MYVVVRSGGSGCEGSESGRVGEEVRFMKALRAFCVFGAVLEKFLPRERKFFDLLEGLAAKAVRAAEMLDSLDSASLERVSKDLRMIEEEADEIVHQIIQGLLYDHTRVTEEKGDIRYFAHNLDNVVDGIEKAVSRLAFVEFHEIPEPVRDFSPIILEATKEIQRGVLCLRSLREDCETLETCCVRINELENKADILNRKWLKTLMTAPISDANELQRRILLKEVVDILEDTMDQCEDVANILETFRVKGGI